MFFNSHPLIGLLISSALVILGFGAGGDLHMQVQPIAETGFPLWVKDLFQCIAWTGAGATGAVAVHGFWIKNITPKIQKRKARKK